MSKSLLAIVWVAGPLTGTLVQPYIGVRSDNCRIRYGKRRPFMLVGATASLISFLSLAWAREIVGGFLGLFGTEAKSEGVKVVTICFAIIWVYIVDIAINAGTPSYTMPTGLAEASHSSGRHTSIHCGQCSHTPARTCQRLGRRNYWNRKHLRLLLQLCQPS